MELKQETLEAFRLHVLQVYPDEACGFVVGGQYVATPNTAENPRETFRIAPIEYVRAAALGEIQAVLHSHPYALNKPPKYPPEWPSTADMVSWMAGNVPWGICATEGEGISALVWLDEEHPEPLVGRQFISGITDCYSLIRDWYRQVRGITIKNYPRGMEWWAHGKNLYEENFEQAGFTAIPLQEATIGDLVFMQIRSPVVNHAAVITGPNEILHHFFSTNGGRLSAHDSLSKWNRVITKAVRYVGDAHLNK